MGDVEEPNGNGNGRGPLLAYGMPVILLLWGSLLFGHTIFLYFIGANVTPEIGLYIVGIIDRLSTAAFIFFFATWLAAESTTSIFTDLALYAALNAAGALVPIAFAVIWYWDLAIGCTGSSGVKAIEKPMCSGNSDIYEWVHGVTYVFIGGFNLIALAMSFVDFYYRRLSTLTVGVTKATKKLIPKKLRETAKELRGALRGLKEEEAEDMNGVMTAQSDFSSIDMLDGTDFVTRGGKKKNHRGKRRNVKKEHSR